MYGLKFDIIVGGTHDMFKHSNRMGLSGTLHRISALKNHHNEVCGLTYRVGRHIPGKPGQLSDLSHVCQLPISYACVACMWHDNDPVETHSMLACRKPSCKATVLLVIFKHSKVFAVQTKVR